ncbi:SHOCT domain-containing protein [Micropruina sp.]|uniref:SHOCT domain-containing protein n=1 Tax=Micropruina sp. TaxID=2737536 RepID=UPI0039E2235D
MGFWDFFWLLIWAVLFIGYLIVLFQIVIDVFRNDGLNGMAKAVWVVALLVVPALTGIVYLIVHGSGMTARQRAGNRPAPEPSDDYVRIVQAPNPADQISQAKALLDSGAITEAEYVTLKAKALG